MQRAVLAEGGIDQPLVLHSDNGSPMKGATLLETRYRLGVVTSYSRPRTRNDNPYSEAYVVFLVMWHRAYNSFFYFHFFRVDAT